MLRPRWRKVFRDLWIYRSRSLLVVLAIAVGIAGAGAVLTTWGILRSVVDVGYRASNPPMGTLRLNRVDADALALAERVTGIAQTVARGTASAQLRVGNGWQAAQIVVADSFAASPLARLALEAGAWPARAGEIAVERSALELFGAGVGDSVLLRIGEGQPVRFATVGIVRDVSQAPGWMEHLVYLYATPEMLRQLAINEPLNQLLFTVDDPSPTQALTRRLAYQVRDTLVAAGYQVLGVNVPFPGRHIHASQMDSLLYTQAAFGLVALLLSALLVVNLVEALITNNRREIGVMKTLGGRHGQIVTMYLMATVVLGLTAAVIAIPIAELVGQRYAEFSAGLLNFDAAQAQVPLWVPSVLLAVAAFLPVIAAGWSVWRGCGISAGEALRDLGLSTNESQTPALLSSLGGVARPLVLSLRNAFRKRRRMVLTLATIATGGGVFVGSLNLKSSIRGTMQATFDALRYDLMVQVADREDPASIERAIAAAPGVVAAEARLGARLAVQLADGTLGNSFVVTGLPANTTLVRTTVTAGRWLVPGDRNVVVISERMAEEQPELSVGSTVQLVRDGRPSPWTIVGVVPGFQEFAYAPLSAVAALVGDGRATSIAVRTSDSTRSGVAAARQSIVETLAASGRRVASVAEIAEGRAATEDHVIMVIDFLTIMAWLMLLVGGLSLASTMSLSVLERTREIGIMRAIGASRGAIHLIIQSEGLLIALIAWALAFPISAAIGRVLGAAFARVFFKTPPVYVPNLQAVGVWLAVAIVLSILACAWPAVRATRISVRSALSYE